MNRILFKNFRGGYNMLCIKVSFIRIAKAKETKYKEKTGFFSNFSYLHSVSNFTGIRI